MRNDNKPDEVECEKLLVAIFLHIVFFSAQNLSNLGPTFHEGPQPMTLQSCQQDNPFQQFNYIRFSFDPDGFFTQGVYTLGTPLYDESIEAPVLALHGTYEQQSQLPRGFIF